jgi:hypothetical protein
MRDLITSVESMRLGVNAAFALAARFFCVLSMKMEPTSRGARLMSWRRMGPSPEEWRRE